MKNENKELLFEAEERLSDLKDTGYLNEEQATRFMKGFIEFVEAEEKARRRWPLWRQVSWIVFRKFRLNTLADKIDPRIVDLKG